MSIKTSCLFGVIFAAIPVLAMGEPAVLQYSKTGLKSKEACGNYNRKFLNKVQKDPKTLLREGSLTDIQLKDSLSKGFVVNGFKSVCEEQINERVAVRRIRRLIVDAGTGFTNELIGVFCDWDGDKCGYKGGDPQKASYTAHITVTITPAPAQ